ncbi:hypothetical protein ABBQ32_000185 [Trebouxia sp. C0010 RCD-2024]
MLLCNAGQRYHAVLNTGLTVADSAHNTALRDLQALQALSSLYQRLLSPGRCEGCKQLYSSRAFHSYSAAGVQVVLSLKRPDGVQLNLDPGHLPNAEALKHIQLDLGYTFNNTELLRLALVHPSVGQINNARLAWLGDAVLEMLVSHNVYKQMSSDEPGHLNKAMTSPLHRLYMTPTLLEPSDSTDIAHKLDYMLDPEPNKTLHKSMLTCMLGRQTT